MIEISLIIATLNRTLELNRLISTLALQSFSNFEIIIVDQNMDDRINSIIQRARHLGLNLQHLRHHPPNLAQARNQGINAAVAPWIGFPDDDCWYEPNTLERLFHRSQQHDKPQGVIGRWVEQDPALSPASLCWKKSSHFRDLPVSSITLFLHKTVINRVGGFDDRLGVGQWFGAAEETDIVLRALKDGANIVYDPTIWLHHKANDKHSELNPENRMLCKKRARGTGALYAKHRLPAWVIARGLLAPVLKPLIQGQFKNELTHGMAMAQGRYQGWMEWNRHNGNHRNRTKQFSAVQDDKA